MSNKNPLICVRECSCDDERISSIEEIGFFAIFYTRIMPDESAYEYNREDLEGESRNRESECNPSVMSKLEAKILSKYRVVFPPAI